MKITTKAKKNGGFLVSLELLLVSTILVIGLVTGLTAVRDAMASELRDTAQAIESINQSYEYDGLEYNRTDPANNSAALGDCFAMSAGSFYNDVKDGTISIECIPAEMEE